MQIYKESALRRKIKNCRVSFHPESTLFLFPAKCVFCILFPDFLANCYCYVRCGATTIDTGLLYIKRTRIIERNSSMSSSEKEKSIERKVKIVYFNKKEKITKRQLLQWVTTRRKSKG
jgi:hypothetical protein